MASKASMDLNVADDQDEEDLLWKTLWPSEDGNTFLGTDLYRDEENHPNQATPRPHRPLPPPMFGHVDDEDFHDLYALDELEWELGMRNGMDWDDYHIRLANHLFSVSQSNENRPNYPCGDEVMEECQVCLETVKLRSRLCCTLPVCTSCMETYLVTEVQQGNVKIECVNGSCKSYVHRDEILGRLPIEMKDKYYKFLVNANKDPNVKTCPRCCRITELLPSDQSQVKDKYGRQLECKDCSLVWCFDCQAPYHPDVTCRDFRKGDNLVRSWAKEKKYGHQNAQRCPKCKIFIERKGGCDHMVCSKCNANFCYRCGERYCDLKFFGNHMSRYSPFGCKFNYLPERPATRRLVRGSVFGVKMLGGVVLLGLGLAAGAVLLGASVVILPAFGGYKYHKYRQIKKHNKRMKALFRKRSLNTKHALMVHSLMERQEREHFDQSLNDFVRLGIRTGDSQQVQVLVHHPDPVGGPSSSEQQHSAEIQMNIKDVDGRVTLTTAELSGDGSGDVLHVRTSYKQPQQGENNDPSPVDDGENEFVEIKDLEDIFEEFDDSSSVSSEREETLFSSGASVDSSTKTKLPDLAINSENPQGSRRSSQSSLEEREGVARRQEVVADDKEESMTQTGCFLKLFSKKLNQLEREREKSSSIQKVERKEPDICECPDVISCALESEKRKQKVGGASSSGSVIADDNERSSQPSSPSEGLAKLSVIDPYYGLINSESNATSF